MARETRRRARDKLRATLERQFESLPLVELMEQRTREEAQPAGESRTFIAPKE